MGKKGLWSGYSPRFLLGLLAGWAVLLWALYVSVPKKHPEITVFYVQLQDRWLLLTLGAVWSVAGLVCWRWRRMRAMDLPHWLPMALAGVMFALAWAGHYGVLAGHDLSRDEQMVSFDAAIYRSGRLAQSIPPAWQADIDRLNTVFMMPLAHPVAWVSTYLPGNAMLHALLGSATGPLALAVSVLALWGVARRLLPADKEAQAVALGLFALSGQALYAAMSNFAMPLHLAANLVWLWLFLRDERRADVAAIVVGMVATGLHQPLFHPMFVAPWLALLLADKRWGRLALYGLAYGAIGAFWLWWPHVTLGLVSGPDSKVVSSGATYLSRLMDALSDSQDNGPQMAANLLRMATWTHPALFLLALLGALAAKVDRRVAALAAGVLLPLLVMGVILPYQGHGFGYRYLHQALGNLALLGGYGWLRLGGWRPRLRSGLLALSAGSLLALLPMQGWFAHRLYGAFAQASDKIDTAAADYVVIGQFDAPLALDLAFNRANLSNRPLRLMEENYDDLLPIMPRLCAHGETIALPRRSFYFGIGHALHMMPGYTTEKRLAWHRREWGKAGCRVIDLY